MSSNRPPLVHHYIPQFLLREWTVDGALHRFQQPRPGKVVEHRKPTSAVGAQERLYEVPAVPPEIAQNIEAEFLKFLDTAASEVHRLIVARNVSNLNAAQRSAWTRFILSLFIRGPDTLAAYKAGFKAVYDRPDPAIQARYEASKKPDDPPTVEEYIDKHSPDAGFTAAMTQLPGVMQNEGLGQHINNMGWSLLEISQGAFLMSDQPLIMNNGLGKQEGHIALPVGPRHLFLATNNVETFRAVTRLGDRALVRKVNELVVGRARHFVAAHDLTQRRFIQNRFGRSPETTIAELFAEAYAQD